MADETTANDPEQDGTPAGAGEQGSTDQRLGRLESAVERIEQAITGIAPSHDEAQQHTEDKLDRPSNVAEQVRAELEKARREQEAADRAAAERGELEGLKERVAKLAETPPAPPSLKRVKILGWGDGRS